MHETTLIAHLFIYLPRLPSSGDRGGGGSHLMAETNCLRNPPSFIIGGLGTALTETLHYLFRQLAEDSN